MNLAQEALDYYGEHLAECAQDVVGFYCDPIQKTILDDLMKYHFVAVKSGSGVGKTAVLAIAILTFISTHPMCKIPATAPSQHQLYDLLWSECFTWINKSPYLQKTLNWTQTRIGVRGYEPSWYAVARTASVSPSGDIAEGLQGFHSEDAILFIVDECSGVADAVFPAMLGALTGKNAYCILAGNPTKREGYFFDVFNKESIGKIYKKHTVSCYDSPRVTQEWINMMADIYGVDHPIFQIKVLGEFPDADEDLLIPPAFIDQMQNNSKDLKVSPQMAIHIGVDPGKVHASSIAYVVQGNNVLHREEKQKHGTPTDTLAIAEWISDLIKDWSAEEARVDGVGFGGDVCDVLKPMYGNKIVPIVGSATSPDPVYLNLRAFGYWNLRKRVPHLWCKSWSPRLIAEMGSIHKRDSQRGKIHVETKQEMLRRAQRSPDDLDALMYALIDIEEIDAMGPFVFSNSIVEVNNALSIADTTEFYRSRWKNAPRA